jgi:hypothetical protein
MGVVEEPAADDALLARWLLCFSLARTTIVSALEIWGMGIDQIDGV